MPEPDSTPTFDRVLGSFGATAISIGGIIGSGIFFIIGFAAADAGAAVIVSMLLAGLVAVFTALSFASLGSKIPKEGGEYQFVYIAFGPTVGYFGGIFWILATGIGAVTVSIALSSYLTRLIGFGSTNVFAAAFCLVFMGIDLIGLRISSKLNDLLVIIKIGVLILFVLICLPFIKPSNFNNFFAKGPNGILTATVIIFFAYSGFGKITAAAEEVKDPQKTIPLAIIIAIAVSTILYLATSTAAIGVVGASSLASLQFRNAPLAHVMLATGFPWAFLIISIGAITATASVLLIQMLGLSRTIYAMSKNNQLPKVLSELHPSFKTPYKAQIIMGIVMACGAFFLNAISVIILTSLGILVYYAIVNLAALTVKKQDGGFDVNPIIPTLGFISCVSLVVYFLWFSFGMR